MRERPTKTKSNYPVSLAEAKRHLRIDDSWDKDNDYVRGLIEASTQKCEEYIGKDIAETDSTLKIYDFSGSCFWVEEGNFLDINSIQQSDASTSLPVSKTEVLYNRFYVELESTTEQDPIVINYKTGFTPGNVPALIKQAVLIKIADLYDVERNSYTYFKETYAYQKLLDSFKIILY